ncbi:MAG: GAF domain-containing protein [Myxococcota bacterium]
MLSIPCMPSNEEQRLKILRQLDILDTEAEESFDDLVHLASYMCRTPIALVTLVDADRQWFKARKGLDVQETSREASFCAHAVADDATLVVRDTLQDVRFSANPLVLGAPRIRFYAGVPMRTREGLPMGTLCVIDRQPRQLSDDQLDALKRLSRQASQLLEQHRQWGQLSKMLDDLKLLSGFIPICSYCRKMRTKDDAWVTLEQFILEHSGAVLTHGMCDTCFARETISLKQNKP